MVASMGVGSASICHLCARNGMLEKTGLKIPVFRKTGTTIVGLVFSVSILISHPKILAYIEYQGHVSTALVLGGVDCTGPHLHYTQSLAAMSVFEAKYKEGLTGKTEYLRNHLLPNPRTYVSSRGYSFAQEGRTEVLSTKITPLRPNAEVTAVGDAMEE
ncbi:hypothetical protein BDA96_03G039000 [Sorghum bicolor]|uniref:Uncharacterized protein n=2 Tax=Sorghum bicolor TaxID=4558 RepID=A0A921UL58_SORBI|nr:hypothetical protein BDA96_03G039000 [Sorghum bicolor]OQU86162.1 hypothetical protein SORBI_3003G035601 [Sorghum bicolor]